MSWEVDVQAELRRHGLVATPAPGTAWLTERGHLNDIVQQHAPAEVIEALDDVHSSLGGDRRALARCRNTPIHTGLLVNRQRIQIDDVGHFTSARLQSLSLYPSGLPFGFNLDQYRALIEAWRERAAAVFSRRSTPDFDFAGGRRARLAFEDALLDLLTPIFTGLPVVRVASPDGDARAAAHALTLRIA